MSGSEIRFADRESPMGWGPHEEDVLILKCKQALPSVLHPRDSPGAWPHQGQRVVEGQRLVQTHSNPFLGWATSPNGDDLIWRHFHDRKGSVKLEALGHKGITDQGRMCAWVLAKANAPSSKAAPIAAWIGGDPAFEQAMATLALSSSQTVVRDDARFCSDWGTTPT